MRVTRMATAGAAVGVALLGSAGPALATGTPPKPKPPNKLESPAAHELESSTGNELKSSAQERKPPPFTATIAPKSFHDGDKLTITATGCLVRPVVTDETDKTHKNKLFTTALKLTKKEKTDSKGNKTVSWVGSAVTKAHLVAGKTYKVVVTCKGGSPASITFTTTVAKAKVDQAKDDNKDSTVPKGAPNTGDGTSAGRQVSVPPIAAGAALALGGGALGLVALRRRKVREDA